MPAHDTPGVDILDPTIHPAATINPAPRLHGLEGTRLGLLDNSKERADVFLATLAERLGERYHLATVISRRKSTYSRVAPPSLIADLGETCDCVITAMGA